jgi:hypothetical protein
MGDEAAAARYIGMLIDLSRRHMLPHWAAFGARFEQARVVKAGGLGGDPTRHSGSHEEGGNPNFSFRSLTGVMLLAEALGGVGRIAEGLALLEAGTEQFESSCFTPEVIRLKGELLLLRRMPDAEGSAEALFLQALEAARERGTLSWELRAAVSLAGLLRDHGRPAEARACLQPVYDRFTEGFGTPDLIAAKRLLDDLSTAGCG